MMVRMVHGQIGSKFKVDKCASKDKITCKGININTDLIKHVTKTLVFF